VNPAAGISLLLAAGCAASAAAPPPTSVRVGRMPLDLAIADLDHDGHLDLVTADGRGRQLSVRLWRRGSYRAARAVRVAMEPHIVVAADFDRDGRVDLAATGHDDPGVHVFFGDGSGRFRRASGAPFAAHAGTHAHNHGLVAGDLDGDGDIDLATCNQDLGSVSVLLGDGRGRVAHAAGSPLAVGRQPYPLAIADLDQSGSLDLVVPLVGGDAVAVFLNDGHARFRAAPGSPIATVARPYHVAIADLDGDRALDAVVSHDDTDVVTILRGDGRGRLRESSRLSAGQRPGGLVIADLDGDGDADVAAAAGDKILLLRGDGRGHLSAEPLFSAGESWRLAAADLDGDGRPEVAAPDAARDLVRLCRVCPATTTSRRSPCGCSR